MSLHYKFKSSTDYRTITFDGPSIALSDLREMIMAQNSLAKSPDDTLEITNAQTKEGKKLFHSYTGKLHARLGLNFQRIACFLKKN